MAAYIKNNVSLVLIAIFLFFVFSSYADFSMMVTKDDINNLCTRKEIDSSLCFEVINKIPGIATIDFSGVAKFLINRGSQKASALLKQFQSLDRSSKGSFATCSETFDVATGCFDNALKSLEIKDYVTLNFDLGCTINNADECTSELSSVKPSRPELVKEVSIVTNLSVINLNVLECYIVKEKTMC